MIINSRKRRNRRLSEMWINWGSA